MAILDMDKNVIINSGNVATPDSVELDATFDDWHVSKKNRIKFELEGEPEDKIRIEFEDQGPFRPRENETRGVYEATIENNGKATVKTLKLDRFDRKYWKYSVIRYRGGSQHSKNDPRVEIKD